MKSEYSIREISKKLCCDILGNFHYLSGISKGFKSGVNIGLMCNGEVVGVCIFTGFPVPELLKGIYGLPRNEQSGFFELSRLCLHPEVQQKEHNMASWFVSKSIKYLRKANKVRALLSYADTSHHKGTIYRACNFKYYGLTAKKKDFWIVKKEDGSYIKHSRGKIKGLIGEWRDRTRKHRFLITYDKSITPLWVEVSYQSINNQNKE